MAEYIKREDALDAVLFSLVGTGHQSQAIYAIRDVPIADVVEVVRCKDCNHAISYSCKNDACYKAIICEYKIGIGDENFYCACAGSRTPKERGGDK